MTPSRKLLAMMISSGTSGRGNPLFYQFLLHNKPLHPSYLPASRVIGMVRIYNEVNGDKENFRSSAIDDKSQKFTAIPERVLVMKLSQFEERLNQISNIFKNHPASNHPLFSYLKSQSDQGFNKMQFAIYYANFLYRTKETIPSVALALARAALEGDNSTVAMHGRNLGDETGHGNPDLVHSK